MLRGVHRLPINPYRRRTLPSGDKLHEKRPYTYEDLRLAVKLDINMRKDPAGDHPFISRRQMCEALNIPESTIRSYIKRMKKFGETDVVRPLDAYYVERLHEDFSKIILQTKKILEVATAGVKVDKSTQVDSYRIGCGFDTREIVQARNPFFFDPSHKTPRSRGLCGSLDDSVQVESRYDSIREYYYVNYFEQGKRKT